MGRDKNTRRYRLGLDSLVVPETNPFSTFFISIHPIVTDQDLISLGEVAEQQNIKYLSKSRLKILKQTH